MRFVFCHYPGPSILDMTIISELTNLLAPTDDIVHVHETENVNRRST